MAGRFAASLRRKRSRISLAPARLGRGEVVEAADHVDVLQAREVLVDGGVLAREADHVAKSLGVADDVVTGDARAAGVGFEQRRQDPDRGSFARAVRSEQPENRARLDLEIDAVEGPHVAEALPDPVDDYRGLAQLVPPPEP